MQLPWTQLVAAFAWVLGCLTGIGLGFYLGARQWRALAALRAKMLAREETGPKMQDSPGSFQRRVESRAIEIAGRRVLNLPPSAARWSEWDVDD